MTIFIVTTVLFAIAFVSVCLRCFVRLKIVKSFGWDDGFMVLAMVCKMTLLRRSMGILMCWIGAEHLLRDMWNCGITPRVCKEVSGT